MLCSHTVSAKMGVQMCWPALAMVVLLFIVQGQSTKTLVEGDIADATVSGELWKDELDRVDDGEIPYIFKGTFSDQEKKIIQEALSYISEEVRCIQFR